jgi:hypothetical protein
MVLEKRVYDVGDSDGVDSGDGDDGDGTVGGCAEECAVRERLGEDIVTRRRLACDDDGDGDGDVDGDVMVMVVVMVVVPIVMVPIMMV